MISSVGSQSSNLSQMFLQNRFPEPKEEPLLSLKNSKRNDDDSSTAAAKQQSGAERVSFAQAMQKVELSKNTQKGESNSQEKDNKTLRQGQNEDVQKDAYEQLKVKAQYTALLWP